MKKIYLGILFILLLIGFLYQTAMLIREKNEDLKQAQRAYLNLNKTKLSTDLPSIREIITNRASNQTEIILNSMNFVFDNSIHAIDEERNALMRMPFNAFLKTGFHRLLESHRSDDYKKIHLSCGLRSILMHTILNTFNISSRIVQVYSDSNHQFSAHRMLEVLNPDTQQWELWDPDHRVSYVSKTTNNRINAIEFIFDPKNSFTPVNGDIRGWTENHVSNLLNGFEGAILFENNPISSPGAVIIVNPYVFDMDAPVHNGRSFNDLLANEYRHYRLIKVNSNKFRY